MRSSHQEEQNREPNAGRSDKVALPSRVSRRAATRNVARGSMKETRNMCLLVTGVGSQSAGGQCAAVQCLPAAQGTMRVSIVPVSGG